MSIQQAKTEQRTARARTNARMIETRRDRARRVVQLHESGMEALDIADALNVSVSYVHTKMRMYDKQLRDERIEAANHAAADYYHIERWARALLACGPGLRFGDTTSATVKDHVRILCGIVEDLLDGTVDAGLMRQVLEAAARKGDA